ACACRLTRMRQKIFCPTLLDILSNARTERSLDDLASSPNRVVLVGVHVPDEVRRDRDESAAALAEASGQQQELAQRLRVIHVIVVGVPLAADGVGTYQGRGVVS